MAHPYSTAARLKRYLAGQGERYLSLLDRNDDGVADTDGTQTVEDAVLELSANDIDADLGAVYSVPFATVSPTAPATAPTYGQVGDLCDLRACYHLWFWRDPNSPECVQALEQYEKAVAAYRNGDKTIPGATLVSAGQSRRSIAYESIGTENAGAITNGYRNVSYTSEQTGQTHDPTRVL